MIQAKAQNCIEEMLSYIESADYAGYDPYDALNSPLLRLLSRPSKLGQDRLYARPEKMSC